MTRHRTLLLVTLLALLCVGALPAAADTTPLTARSWSSAVLGAEDWFCGALPPPGFHMLNYFLFYDANEFKGRHGGEVTSPPFTDFETDASVLVLRPLYVANTKILGANPAWHVVIPLFHQEMSSDFFQERRTGLGDIYVSPLILGWHDAPWHYVAGLDVICPTGRYSQTDVLTIGHNHWTFEPAFAVSYAGPSRFTASAKFMYDIHTEDHSTDYLEGDAFHCDYCVGYALDKACKWRAGLAGYFLRSLEEDEFSGTDIDDSEEQVLAVGPSVWYQDKGNCFELKVMKEFEAENRPEGVAAWLRWVKSF